MFGLKNKEILTYLMLIIVGYFVAKMFSMRCEGFSIRNRNLCTDPTNNQLVKGKKKQMGVVITTEGGNNCNTMGNTCVDDDTIYLGWSETDGPDCTSNSCGKFSHWYHDSDNTPTYYWDNNSGNYLNLKDDYDGKWHDTEQNSDNLYTLSELDVESLCYLTKDGYKEYTGCMLGTRALCGFKINPTPNSKGQGGKCPNVTNGIPGYCKKNEYCCNSKCCSQPCHEKGGFQICRT